MFMANMRGEILICILSVIGLEKKKRFLYLAGVTIQERKLTFGHLKRI